MMKENYWSLTVMGHCWSKVKKVLGHHLGKMKMVHHWNKVAMVKENCLSKMKMEHC